MCYFLDVVGYLGPLAMFRMILPPGVRIWFSVSKENKDQQETRRMWFVQYLTFSGQERLVFVQTTFHLLSGDLYSPYFLYILLCLFRFFLYLSLPVVIIFSLFSLDLFVARKLAGCRYIFPVFTSNLLIGIYFWLYCILKSARLFYHLVSVSLCDIVGYTTPTLYATVFCFHTYNISSKAPA